MRDSSPSITHLPHMTSTSLYPSITPTIFHHSPPSLIHHKFTALTASIAVYLPTAHHLAGVIRLECLRRPCLHSTIVNHDWKILKR